MKNLNEKERVSFLLAEQNSVKGKGPIQRNNAGICIVVPEGARGRSRLAGVNSPPSDFDNGAAH